jgi:hypothetical protein
MVRLEVFLSKYENISNSPSRMSKTENALCVVFFFPLILFMRTLFLEIRIIFVGLAFVCPTKKKTRFNVDDHNLIGFSAILAKGVFI